MMYCWAASVLPCPVWNILVTLMSNLFVSLAISRYFSRIFSRFDGDAWYIVWLQLIVWFTRSFHWKFHEIPSLTFLKKPTHNEGICNDDRRCAISVKEIFFIYNFMSKNTLAYSMSISWSFVLEKPRAIFTSEWHVFCMTL